MSSMHNVEKESSGTLPSVRHSSRELSQASIMSFGFGAMQATITGIYITFFFIGQVVFNSVEGSPLLSDTGANPIKAYFLEMAQFFQVFPLSLPGIASLILGIFAAISIRKGKAGGWLLLTAAILSILSILAIQIVPLMIVAAA